MTQVETIGETVRQIATLERVASWTAVHGSDEDVFIAAASLCRLTGNLADQMLSHGLSVAETSEHRATLLPSFHADRLGAALVTELRRGHSDRTAEKAVALSEPDRMPDALPEPGADFDHHRLCPLGGGETRWYVCAIHQPAVVFQAGSGYLDAIANSCPRCARLSRSYLGCACGYVDLQVSREKREGRKVRLIEEAESFDDADVEEVLGDDDNA